MDRTMWLCRFAWIAAFSCLIPLPLHAEQKVDYTRSIKPLFVARCYACHGALQQKNGLRIDTVALMKKGGESGPAIVPGKSDKSLLVDHLLERNAATRMPPEGEGEAISPKDINLIRRWIDEGAQGPIDEQPERDPKDHWAFKQPVKTTIPTPSGRGTIRNPIDAFLAVEFQKHNLTPQTEADKRVLLRRVYLDLIGLPPTREEQEAFVADTSANAYEKVIDRLLASKQYGERWGRHWMDIWRYSDWWGLGAEVRNSQKHIWHWRDWIIESLNDDKGYDQMVREMFAADELYPNDLDKLRGTGYLARSYFKFNRTTWLDEVIEHSSKAFLGLTLNCSKCHDHKYDPFTQQEYYRLRAIFEPYQVRAEMVAGETDLEKNAIPRVFDCDLDRPTYLFVRGDEKNPRKDNPLSPGIPELISFGKLEIQPIQLPLESYRPGLRPHVVETYRTKAEQQIATARAAVMAAEKRGMVNEADQRALRIAEKSLAVAEAQLEAVNARAEAERAKMASPPAQNAVELARKAVRAERQVLVLQAQETLLKAEAELANTAADKKAPVEKKVASAKDAVAKAEKLRDTPAENFTPLCGALKTLESNVESEASRSKPFPATSTGRRSAFVRWLTDRRHPLTARVAVNHIWARHFGKPLVATVFDFGRKGAVPTHPELLDWLAVEFMEHGWSMKHLHRLMVTSTAYRRTSSAANATEANRKADPENRTYWRMNPVRLEAQVIRDALLHLAGDLDFTMGGPSIPVTDEASRRRSLYYVHSHNDHQKFLSIFDDANVLECYRRADSIVPQQALALENSKLALFAAEKITRKLIERFPKQDDTAFARAAFETVLGTTPTSAEIAACESAIQEWTASAIREKKPEPATRARVNLVHALLNHNDFVTVR